MTALSVTATALQVLGLLAAAPFVVGAMRQVRAKLEGRAGPGLGPPWRDLRKLLRKQDITPDGTTLVFVLAPAVVAGTTLLIAAIAPLLSTGSRPVSAMITIVRATNARTPAGDATWLGW